MDNLALSAKFTLLRMLWWTNLGMMACLMLAAIFSWWVAYSPDSLTSLGLDAAGPLPSEINQIRDNFDGGWGILGAIFGALLAIQVWAGKAAQRCKRSLAVGLAQARD
jgi:hypothetical protein